MAILKVTPGMVERAVASVDWRAVDGQTDADIARQVLSDPDAPPMLTHAETVAALARGVRHGLGLSQPAFARRYGIPLGTLRDWEQGRKRPDSTALTYLRVIAGSPEVVAEVLAVPTDEAVG